MVINAAVLREREALMNVPGNRPGWYRWWAREAEVRALLDSPFLTHKYFDELMPNLHKGMGDLQHYYCIYTGVAVKGSIQARLNWHINQQHTKSAVQSGTLSTLRQSLASLIAGDQYNEAETNDFIDKLMVEYIPVEYEIKSQEAKTFLEENNERNEMSSHVLVLNIKNNKRPEIASFKKDLSQLRTLSKRRGQN